MTTKTITGTYNAGYFVNSADSAVVITQTGSVGGFGLVAGANTTQVSNYGHLQAASGASGVSLLGTNHSLTNHAGGYIKGGQAIGASGAGAHGNNGGVGGYLSAYGTILSAGGDMVGGGGGAGLAGSFGGDGGFGGDGASFHAGGYLRNTGGYVFGGRGGSAGSSSYGTTARGGTGGSGGVGVAMAGYGTVDNAQGGLIGGYGGQGGGGTGPGGYGGTGGVAVYLQAGGIALVQGGFIEGGIGGRAGYGAGGAGAGGRGGAGVDLNAGGYVDNHGLIIGGQGGAGKDGLTQYGQELGQGGDGVFLRAGGVVSNYSLISGGTGGAGASGTRPGNGGDGVAAVGGDVLNFATIAGGGGGYSKTLKSFCGYGVSMAGAGFITNGASTTRGAVIEGNGGHYSQGANYNGIGVFAGAGSQVTLTNWATISGASAVVFQSTYDTLIAEAGSVLAGAVLGGGGTLQLGPGTGTLTGLDASGNVTVSGFLGASSTTALQDFGTLEIAVGGSFATTASASLAAGKTLVDDGVLAQIGAMTVAGTVAGTGSLVVEGKLTFQAKSALSVATVLAGSTADKITIGSTLVYGGLWDQTRGALSIAKGKTFELTGATDYLYGKTTTNNGNLEYAGAGRLFVQTALVNNGALVIDSGMVTLESATVVSGTGNVLIAGGTLVASAFNQAVTFQGAGTLILDQSQSYTATVSGFSTVGANFLDLGDIGFVGPNQASFAGTAISGVLTVSDGTHTAHISLAGDYLSSTFVCASDGHGGVIIHDPTQGAGAPASPHGLVAAMAAMAPGSAATMTASAEPAHGAATSLLVPRGGLG